MSVVASWTSLLRADPLPWLLEADDSCLGVRYLTLRDLLDAPRDDREVRSALREAMERGPIAEILARQQTDGSLGDDARYDTKYHGTAWSLISLWQIGGGSR